jgi:hypothetical protein
MIVDDLEEEKRLEEYLFGKPLSKSSVSPSAVDELSSKPATAGEDDDGEYGDVNFMIDTSPNFQLQEKINEKEKSSSSVWHDEDDDELLVDLNQINRLKKLKASLSTTQNQKKRALVTGHEYSQLLKERYDLNNKKTIWNNSQLLTGKSSGSYLDADEDDNDILGNEGKLNSWLCSGSALSSIFFYRLSTSSRSRFHDRKEK